MSPEYNQDDFLIVSKIFFKRLLKEKRDVLVNHPKFGLILKRIISIDQSEKTVDLQGLNSKSVGPEKLKAIPFHRVFGRPIFHIKSK